MTESHNYCDAPTGECLQARRIAELQRENARLREALEFYATHMQHPLGDKARAALEGK